MGLCHIGTCHLLQDDNAEYNFDFAKEELDRAPVFVNFSKREQGILLQKGNPKGIHCISDLAKKGVSIVNRPVGTGTRLLLDYEIARSDISSSLIEGYQREVSRHMDAGLEVLSGRADAAPAIRAVAGMLDLDFLPLAMGAVTICSSPGNSFLKRGFRILSVSCTRSHSGILPHPLPGMIFHCAARCFFQTI